MPPTVMVPPQRGPSMPPRNRHYSTTAHRAKLPSVFAFVPQATPGQVRLRLRSSGYAGTGRPGSPRASPRVWANACPWIPAGHAPHSRHHASKHTPRRQPRNSRRQLHHCAQLLSSTRVKPRPSQAESRRRPTAMPWHGEPPHSEATTRGDSPRCGKRRQSCCGAPN